MPTIEQNGVLTVINVFTVRPDDQQRLIDHLVESGETLKRLAPGFVSASYHRGLEGDRVANYAQWRSREDYEAAMRLPEVKARIGKAPDFARPDWHLYEVAHVVAAEDAR